MRIWGRLNSLNVQKAVWAAEETGRPYERIDAGGAFGVVGTPEYGKLNPNRLVPVLEDGAFVLWESNAITRHLAAQYGGPALWPAEPRARAEADRWSDWISGTFNPAMGPAFMNLVRTPPQTRDDAAVEASRAKTDALAAMLDDHLARHAFVGGAAFSYGDVIVGPSIHRWLNLAVARTPRPHLERWYAAVMERPAARKVLTLPIT